MAASEFLRAAFVLPLRRASASNQRVKTCIRVQQYEGVVQSENCKSGNLRFVRDFAAL
jgi:hypothetical protein